MKVMLERSESMASSTVRRRQEEGGVGFPNLPTEKKKRCCGCYFARIVVKATKLCSTCPSLSPRHTHTHTLTRLAVRLFFCQVNRSAARYLCTGW